MRSSRVRPAPIRPAMPRISPRRSVKRRRSRLERRRRSRIASPGARGAARKQVADVAARPSAPTIVVVRRVGGRAAAGVAAVAQHDEAVGDLLHFLDEVRDVDDRVPLRLAAGASRSNSRRTSSRPRLLVGSSRTSTRQPTASARAISTSCCAATDRRADRRVGRDVVVPELARARRSPIARMRARSHEAAAHRLGAEHDVLHHAQVRRERQLLVDHRDAGAARLERICAARRARRRSRIVAGVRRAARRRGSPSACSCRRRSGRPARRPRPARREDRRRRARPWRRTPCGRRASRSAARLSGFSHCDRSGCSSSFISGVVHVARA